MSKKAVNFTVVELKAFKQQMFIKLMVLPETVYSHGCRRFSILDYKKAGNKWGNKMTLPDNKDSASCVAEYLQTSGQ